MAIAKRAKQLDGYLDGRMLADGRGEYWTLTLWEDEAAMLRFRKDGPHAKGMRKSKAWAKDMHATRWESDAASLPDWDEAALRLAIPAPRHPKRQLDIGPAAAANV